MVKTHTMALDDLKGYASPKTRLARLVKNGSLIHLKRGLFTDTAAVSKRVVAAVLYGPSYISFEYALTAWSLIPERATAVTSGIYNKNKNKVFKTALGEFRYYCLPPAVYPYGITMEEEDGACYLIAAPEKALCDAVYKAPGITSVKKMCNLLLDDWRIELDDLLNLDGDFIRWIAPLYGRQSLRALSMWFTKEAAV